MFCFYLSKYHAISQYLKYSKRVCILSLFAPRHIYQEARFHVTCYIRRSFLRFFFRHQDGIARGGVRSSRSGAAIRRNPFVRWVGGFQSIGRFRHYQSNMSRPGKSNFPIVSRSRARARGRARARVWKTCVSPIAVGRCVAPDRRRRVQDF